MKQRRLSISNYGGPETSRERDGETGTGETAGVIICRASAKTFRYIVNSHANEVNHFGQSLSIIVQLAREGL